MWVKRATGLSHQARHYSSRKAVKMISSSERAQNLMLLLNAVVVDMMIAEAEV